MTEKGPLTPLFLMTTSKTGCGVYLLIKPHMSNSLMMNMLEGKLSTFKVLFKHMLRHLSASFFAYIWHDSALFSKAFLIKELNMQTVEK